MSTRLNQTQPDNREFGTQGVDEACIAVLNNHYNVSKPWSILDIGWMDVIIIIMYFSRT